MLWTAPRRRERELALMSASRLCRDVRSWRICDLGQRRARFCQVRTCGRLEGARHVFAEEPNDLGENVRQAPPRADHGARRGEADEHHRPGPWLGHG